MKRKIIFFVMLLVLTGLFTIFSCKKGTTLVSEHGGFTTPELVGPANGAFLHDTIINLKWNSTSASGDPQLWDVYFGLSGDNPALYKTGVTTQTVTVNVHLGIKYYWKVIGTDANGLKTSSAIWSFEIINPVAPLSLDMTWSTNVMDVIGLDLKPTDVADLRLLIFNADSVTKRATINSSGFENYSGFNTLPDGKYYLAADLSKTINAGDFDKPVNVSIVLSFNQRGTLDTLLNFSNVMTNEKPCASYRTYLATVTKTGNVYVINSAVSTFLPPPPAALAGTWHGLDDGYTSQVVTTISGGKLRISGVGIGWMLNDWGEVMVTNPSAVVDYNLCAGKLTIQEQVFMTTTYLGDPQPAYSIKGTGTFDLSGTYPVMTLTYDFIQEDLAGPIAKYLGLPNFKATLTLDPAGKGFIPAPVKGKALVVKPKLK